MNDKAAEVAKKTAEAAENTNAGGHIGGTYSGQKPDTKTGPTRDDKGDKARPNDGSN